MPVTTQLRDLVSGVGELTARHLQLARLELAEDARFVGLRVGLIAALAPLILVGYGFLCVALALALRRAMAPEAAFALVGVLNLTFGVLGIAGVARQLAGRRVLAMSLEEAERSATLVRRPEVGP